MQFFLMNRTLPELKRLLNILTQFVITPRVGLTVCGCNMHDLIQYYSLLFTLRCVQFAE